MCATGRPLQVPWSQADRNDAMSDDRSADSTASNYRLRRPHAKRAATYGGSSPTQTHPLSRRTEPLRQRRRRVSFVPECSVAADAGSSRQVSTRSTGRKAVDSTVVVSLRLLIQIEKAANVRVDARTLASLP